MVSADRLAIGKDLVTDGFPFLQAELEVGAAVELPAAISFLRFDGVEADAVHLSVDGTDYGWVWRTNGEIKFATKLAAGKHRLQLRLIPNTFNGSAHRITISAATGTSSVRTRFAALKISPTHPMRH